MPKTPRVPSYRLHKQSGQAIVTLPDGLGGRRDVLLGEYDSLESRQKYDQVIAEWMANRNTPASPKSNDVNLNVVILAYWQHAEKVMFRTERKARNKQRLKDALSIVNELYGFSPAHEFRPLALKACRQKMVERGWGREYINAQVNRIRAMFRWAASEEMIADTTYSALMVVEALVEGETSAPEPEKVKPIADEIVEATLPFLSETVAAIVQFQRLTACRPEEACSIRPCDLDVSNPKCWVYRLDQHKTVHHGKERYILIGPKAQEILKPFLSTKLDDYCFSPARSEAERNAELRRNRKTPLTPSHRKRIAAAAKRKPRAGNLYPVNSYRNAIYRACDKAFPPPEPLRQREGETNKQWKARLTDEQKEQLAKWQSEHRWHPNQLRHNRATELRKHGLDITKTVLGHSKVETSQIYAEKDLAAAMELIEKIG